MSVRGSVKATRDLAEGGLGGENILNRGEMRPIVNLQQHPLGYVAGCPGCGKRLSLPTSGSERAYTASGDLDAGTLSLSPSITCLSCGWHGHLQDGEFIPA